jgi:large subunit ribosomal protein L4
MFGPEPRDYSFKLNKKVKALARKAVLSAKVKEGKILVVEDFTFDAPKTKSYVQLLSSLKMNGNDLTDVKSLLVLDTPNALVEPMKPVLPAKPRGAKKRAAFAEAMKCYSDNLKQYKLDKKAYDASLEKHTEQVDKVYDNVVLSSRNLQKSSVVNAKTLNIYQILNANCIVLSESAINRLSQILA